MFNNRVWMIWCTTLLCRAMWSLSCVDLSMWIVVVAKCLVCCSGRVCNFDSSE